MKKSIVIVSILALSITAAFAANKPVLKPNPQKSALYASLKNEMREYLRTDGLIEKKSNASMVTKALTDAEVGDANSFGRGVNFIGSVQTGVVSLQDDCTPDPAFPLGPNDKCVVRNAAPAATSINFPDLGRVTIPGKSAKTLICHWQTPFASFFYRNPTGVYQGFARINIVPTYKIENEVLLDPTLIDPGTGLPFGGSFQTALSGVRDARSLQPGENQLFRQTYTRVCQGGIISKRSLIESYGLTDAQATKFFKKDTKITIGLTGNTVMVDFASIIVGTRFVGD